MPRQTLPVKRVCYADDITVWASGPKIPQLKSMINSYLRDIGIYLKESPLLISALNLIVTLFIPGIYQFHMHPKNTLEVTQLPLERCPKILGVIMDASLSFHKHCNYETYRIDKRNNMLKELAGSSWGQAKETLLLSYNVCTKRIQPARGWCATVMRDCANCIHLILPLRSPGPPVFLESVMRPHSMAGGAPAPCGRH